ncbi:alpha-ketoglutarate-dependent dioxygenase AlkB family protein [Pseudomonas sp. TE3610]
MQNDLFAPAPGTLNLLPVDGLLNDLGMIVSAREADNFLHCLMRDVPWQADTALIKGHLVTSGRHVAWYGDQPYRYSHSGVLRQARVWDLPVLEAIRQRVVQATGGAFNSCVLNRYLDGSQAMGWHSDPEATGPHGLIASLSLGATRKFAFKHKRSGDRRALMLEHGQLIVMGGDTQRHWLHALMRTSQPVAPRISLTFRLFPEHEDWS